MVPSLFNLPTFLSGCAVVGLLLTGACEIDDVGPEETGDGDGDGDGVRIPADDPAVDERLDALGIICESTLSVTGTYAKGAEQPEDQHGCWPVGTWTIQATVDRLGCDPQPLLSSDYVYDVTFDEDVNSIFVAFATDPADERVNLKISTAGDGLCHGAMDHFGTDYAVWSFLPTLQADGTLSGSGTYSLFDEDPF